MATRTLFAAMLLANNCVRLEAVIRWLSSEHEQRPQPARRQLAAIAVSQLVGGGLPIAGARGKFSGCGGTYALRASCTIALRCSPYPAAPPPFR
jgi:hypothetical protein